MRHNFTMKQQRAMAERSGGICEAGKDGTEDFYGMEPGETCSEPAKEFDHVIADALKRTKIASIDEGLHVCVGHHCTKTHEHDRPMIRKAKRVREKNQGIRPYSRPIQSRGFGAWEPNVKQLDEL